MLQENFLDVLQEKDVRTCSGVTSVTINFPNVLQEKDVRTSSVKRVYQSQLLAF